MNWLQDKEYHLHVLEKNLISLTKSEHANLGISRAHFAYNIFLDGKQVLTVFPNDLKNTFIR